MAESAIKKLDEQLKCSICLDTYTDPKLLQCFHTYCTKCLIPLVVRDRQGQLTLTCPTCRQVTSTPLNHGDGVTGLQSAFHINELLEIRDDLKKSKEPIPSQEPRVDIPLTKATCSDHSGKELEFFCVTCGVLVCYRCVVRGGNHYGHDYDPLEEAFVKYKGEIISLLEPIEKQLKTIHTALADLATRSREISDQKVTIEASIHDTVKRLHEVLDVRETELIGQLHQKIQRKLKDITTQRDIIETVQAQLNCCLIFVTDSLKTSSQGEVLKMKTTIMKQVKELTTSIQPELLIFSAEADLTFSASPDITVECKQFGKLRSPGSPDLLNIHATGKGLDVAMIEEKSLITLLAVNYNGAPCEEPLESLQCELVSELTGATVRGSVESKGQSQYEISYQPTIKGRHQLHIKVEDQHIRGSPFPVAVELPVEELGTPILTVSGLKGPWGIAFNQRGEVVISERHKNCVSIFSPSGERIKSFGTYGSDHGQFYSPCGVAVDSEGNILVVDSKNHRIQKFTAEGQFLTSIGTKGNGRLQFDSPHGLTYNPTNNKVYVVDSNHRVTILNSDLSFSGSFRKVGSVKGQFSLPYHIACDSTGKVYVVDGDNHRIQVFTAKGKIFGMFGSGGYGEGELYKPISIAIDTSDRVYVGDYNHRVSVFTPDGCFIKSFGQKGEGLGEFDQPHGLAVDASGVVYVCECNNHRIQLF